MLFKAVLKSSFFTAVILSLTVIISPFFPPAAANEGEVNHILAEAPPSDPEVKINPCSSGGFEEEIISLEHSAESYPSAGNEIPVRDSTAGSSGGCPNGENFAAESSPVRETYADDGPVIVLQAGSGEQNFPDSVDKDSSDSDLTDHPDAGLLADRHAPGGPGHSSADPVGFSEAVSTAAGNSYMVSVVPEGGLKIEAGKAANLTVTFSELDASSKLGSAQLFIPGSLIIDPEADVEVSAGWDYRWDEPAGNSSFNRVLSLWARLESSYLGRGDSLSATFSAVAVSDQTHHFKTKAFQDTASCSEGIGSGPGSVENLMAEGSADPKINVRVEGFSGIFSDGSNLTVGLNDVRDNLNWHYIQEQDIDLGFHGGGWVPIGTDVQYRPDLAFSGAYDGGNYTIHGLAVDRHDSQAGLFGTTFKTAAVTRVRLDNVVIAGRDYCGALVGYNFGGLIRDCHVSGSVAGSGNYVGGIVGMNRGGHIDRCSAAVSVTGNNRVGGLVGCNISGGIISGSSVSGTVFGLNRVGGLAGRNTGVITDSRAYANVTAGSGNIGNVGGLVGLNTDGGLVYRCHAGGAVNAPANDNVGGLVGYNHPNCTIMESFASGLVSGKNCVGGLVGYNLATINNCYASGDVSGINGVGGLIGLNQGTISCCYAVGQVSGNNNSGRLVGKNDGSVLNSFCLIGAPSNNSGSQVSEAAMKSYSTFHNAGWCIVTACDPDPAGATWFIEEAINWPQLWWQREPLEEEAPDPDDQVPERPQSKPGSPDQKGRFEFAGLYGPLHGFGLPGNRLLNHDPLPASYSRFEHPTPVLADRFLVIAAPGPGANKGAPVSAAFVIGGSRDALTVISGKLEAAFLYFEQEINNIESRTRILKMVDLNAALSAVTLVGARLSGDAAEIDAAAEAYRKAIAIFTMCASFLDQEQKDAVLSVLRAVKEELVLLGASL